MSRRRRVDDEDEDEDDPEERDAFELDEEVEYFVLALEVDSVRTSVPNSAQSSHSCSSAPSTFTVFNEARSEPHISH
ncbi:hypothetical protein C439_03683 [Haloferax mediterranei ATCC 33500]|uniref:Uncharacterized protein n=1 Tax=Haloferax mediterranei (strain ATCC 33500 / DSM 1411 / JCM 8866 / NBRC 14739 / NCIMB 2177 / R-4) TaxID=523841 RepID=M0J6S3_HALMT|nr:hypothetical protein BM92_02360 [Haloferax mediterranei ATCC 33500]EMA04028.1 hypothetical protein C439_03683 [Haloferax mediterranei ATCC 33500]